MIDFLSETAANLVGTFVGVGLGLLTARTVTRRERLSHPFALAAAFAVMHVAYGVGFLSGLARFWNRWGEPEPVPTPMAPVPSASGTKAGGR